MKRYDQEVFGVTDSYLVQAAEPIFASAYEDSIAGNTNDGIRTGYVAEEKPMCPYEIVMARRNLL